MKEFLQKNIKGDYYIWFVVLALSVFGILAVYSATGTLAYAEKGGNTEYYLMKHAFLVIFGLATMWLTHLISIQYFSRIAQIMLFLIAINGFISVSFGAFGAHDAARSSG